MLYIIALLLLILVLAIPAARNILFALLGGGLALGVVGLVLLGLFLLGTWLYSLDWSAMATKLGVNRAYRALVKTVEILTPSWLNVDIAALVLLLSIIIGFALFVIHDQRKLRK